jgi:hypothetical protein
MHRAIINQIHSFKRVSVPRYIELKIQKIALIHLGLPDMGKLRDRMEGLLYYDKLKIDFLAEYAFEKVIGVKEFDWVKREKKNYIRKHYSFEGKPLQIVTFDANDLPNPNLISCNNVVFAYVNPDNRVYISGLATKKVLSDFINNLKLAFHETIDFEKLISLPLVEELVYNLD